MIIGFTGKAGAGKDTAAMALGEEFKRFAFADELKKTVNGIFNWNERHSSGDLKEVVDEFWGFSPRRAYQLFGTEFGRALDNDLWIKKAELSIDKTNDYMITDVRFENEADFVRRNGILIHIVGRCTTCVEVHKSEKGVIFRPDLGDFFIVNNSTIKHLHSRVLDITRIMKK
jgi:hypothetical protein